jgi:hypothetical protein
MPQGSLTGRIVMEHLAKPWNNERAPSLGNARGGFLQAQKSEAQTYTSSPANQACESGVMMARGAHRYRTLWTPRSPPLSISLAYFSIRSG